MEALRPAEEADARRIGGHVASNSGDRKDRGPRTAALQAPIRWLRPRVRRRGRDRLPLLPSGRAQPCASSGLGVVRISYLLLLNLRSRAAVRGLPRTSLASTSSR